jgi:glycosyltransferase involved in cell wall biosynthesis
VITRSPWFEPPRIRHQVARQMARFTRVLFVETPEDWRDRGATAREEVAPNVTRWRLSNPASIPLRLQLYVDPLRTFVNRHYLRELVKAAAAELGDRPVLVNFNYDFVEAMRSDRFVTAIYYCNDDFGTWAPDRIIRWRMRRRERATAAAAARCLTVSAPLTAKIARYNPRTETLLPGHDFAEQRPAPRRPGPIRIAYMGYMDGRLHYDWLIAAARQPDMRLTLIGPVVRQAQDIQSLLAMPSVSATGPKVGDALQQILLDADVLVLPYLATRESGMLAATAPNKLFLYLAAAKPIVASDLPALLHLEKGLLYRATSADAFVAALRDAITEDSDCLRERRLAIARENTWDSRGDRLRGILETELHDR